MGIFNCNFACSCMRVRWCAITSPSIRIRHPESASVFRVHVRRSSPCPQVRVRQSHCVFYQGMAEMHPTERCFTQNLHNTTH